MWVGVGVQGLGTGPHVGVHVYVYIYMLLHAYAHQYEVPILVVPETHKLVLFGLLWRVGGGRLWVGWGRIGWKCPRIHSEWGYQRDDLGWKILLNWVIWEYFGKPSDLLLHLHT